MHIFSELKQQSCRTIRSECIFTYHMFVCAPDFNTCFALHETNHLFQYTRQKSCNFEIIQATAKAIMDVKLSVSSNTGRN